MATPSHFAWPQAEEEDKLESCESLCILFGDAPAALAKSTSRLSATSTEVRLLGDLPSGSSSVLAARKLQKVARWMKAWIQARDTFVAQVIAWWTKSMEDRLNAEMQQNLRLQMLHSSPRKDSSSLSTQSELELKRSVVLHLLREKRRKNISKMSAAQLTGHHPLAASSSRRTTLSFEEDARPGVEGGRFLGGEHSPALPQLVKPLNGIPRALQNGLSKSTPEMAELSCSWPLVDSGSGRSCSSGALQCVDRRSVKAGKRSSCRRRSPSSTSFSPSPSPSPSRLRSPSRTETTSLPRLVA